MALLIVFPIYILLLQQVVRSKIPEGVGLRSLICGPVINFSGARGQSDADIQNGSENLPPMKLKAKCHNPRFYKKFSLRHPRYDISVNVHGLADSSGDDRVCLERHSALENLTSGTYILLSG